MGHNQSIMVNRSNPFLLLTLLAVGGANAAAIAWGFGRIAKTFYYKGFASTSSYTQQAQAIVPLSNDRFAVVDGDGSRISVYKVDAQGSITRASDVDTRFQQLVAGKRPAVPVALATPTQPPAAQTTAQPPTAQPTPTQFSGPQPTQHSQQ